MRAVADGVRVNFSLYLPHDGQIHVYNFPWGNGPELHAHCADCADRHLSRERALITEEERRRR